MFFFDCALALLRTLLPQKFYWNGVKLINTHRKRVRDIEARIARFRAEAEEVRRRIEAL